MIQSSRGFVGGTPCVNTGCRIAIRVSFMGGANGEDRMNVDDGPSTSLQAYRNFYYFSSIPQTNCVHTIFKSEADPFRQRLKILGDGTATGRRIGHSPRVHVFCPTPSCPPTHPVKHYKTVSAAVPSTDGPLDGRLWYRPSAGTDSDDPYLILAHSQLVM
ncbi:hypothetical protein K438DRAFT_1782109 [Mycena galopus ATCC 62051]|nr:hypothetical protein K438DRAFT_1782109 [Mycena galopus ATCC 62051]